VAEGLGVKLGSHSTPILTICLTREKEWRRVTEGKGAYSKYKLGIEGGKDDRMETHGSVEDKCRRQDGRGIAGNNCTGQHP